MIPASAFLHWEYSLLTVRSIKLSSKHPNPRDLALLDSTTRVLRLLQEDPSVEALFQIDYLKGYSAFFRQSFSEAAVIFEKIAECSWLDQMLFSEIVEDGLASALVINDHAKCQFFREMLRASTKASIF